MISSLSGGSVHVIFLFFFSFHSLSNFKWSNRHYGNELKMHLNQVFHYHAKRKIMIISWKRERENRSKNNDINLLYSSSPIQFVCFSITIHVMRLSIQSKHIRNQTLHCEKCILNIHERYNIKCIWIIQTIETIKSPMKNEQITVTLIQNKYRVNLQWLQITIKCKQIM